MRYLANGTLLSFYMLFLAACSGDAPQITSLISNPATPVEAGSTVKLTAIYIGGTGSIDNDVGSISSGSSVEVTVDATTTYTLTVIDGAGDTATSSVTVTVGVAPEDVVAPTITSFTADATTIAIGGSVDLSAVFENGTAVIDNGAGSITSGSSVSVSPTTTTTYTLTVTNTADVAVTSSVTVNVVKLDALSLSTGALVQTFQSNSLSYNGTVAFLASEIKVQASAVDAGTTIKVNGIDVDTNNLSAPIRLSEGSGTSVSITATRDAVTTTYSLVITRPTLTSFIEQKLTASDGQNGDFLGYSVSLSGDTLAVGADREDTGGLSAGAVYIYTRSGTTWTEQQILHASNPRENDYFGGHVSLDGDTLAISATGEDGTADLVTGAGAVYIYTRSGTTWTEQQILHASDAQIGDSFGSSVSLDGDTLAVGAWLEDGGESSPATNAGAVYIYTQIGGANWTEQAIIHASDLEGSDWFGRSVSLDGDTLAVGADGEDTGGSSAGAVYVFTRSDSDWSEQKIFHANGAGALDVFGLYLSLSGDTLAVGAPGEDGNGNDFPESGAVYIYTRSGTNWTEQGMLGGAVGDSFGYGVSLSGDTLAVGAYGADASYIYTRFGATWSKRKMFSGVVGSRFGISTSLSGDSLAVGAYLDDTKAPDAGAAYVYQ